MDIASLVHSRPVSPFTGSSSPLSSVPSLNSGGSSPLSDRSTTPFEPSLFPSPTLLPTPAASQELSDDSSTGETGAPPAKRRRLSPEMSEDKKDAEKKDGRRKQPRETKFLNLEDVSEEMPAAQKAELDRLLKALRKKQKIVVIAGAGISVAAGIPDFRSSTGLFKSLKTEHKLKGSGKQLFDASVYSDDKTTTSFHQMVCSMSCLTKSAKPTAFHHLIARLAHEGRLVRLYSQNVDGLDVSLEPLHTVIPLPKKGPWPKTVQLHGGLEKMVCSKCNYLSDFDPELFDGPVPPICTRCQEVDQLRTEVAGKRSHGIGRLRPRMVLYNESNPDEDAIGAVAHADLRQRPDVVIVAGTSLKVPGVRRIVREMCATVRDKRDGLTVWLNNDPPPSGVQLKDCWDLVVKGSADEVASLAALGQWNDPEQSPVDVVSDEELQLVKASTEITVVVKSPSKHKFADATSLPTPEGSPHPHTHASKPVIDVPKVTKLILNNPASRGPSIDTILAPTKPKSAKGATKPGRKTPTTSTLRPTKPRKKATKPVVPNKSIVSFTKAKKAGVSSTLSTTAALKAKADGSRKRSRSASAPPGTPKKTKDAKLGPMDDVSATSPKVNCSPSKMFPNLKV